MRANVQLDEALLEQQREAYAVEGVDEREPAGATTRRKRKKNVYVNGEEVRILSLSLVYWSIDRWDAVG